MKKVWISCYFKKIKDTVYKFTKIGDGDWEAKPTPHKQIPFIYFKERKK